MPGPESKHSIELGALPSKDTLKSPKNSKNSQNSVTLARSVDNNAAHSVECFDSGRVINEFME